MGKYTFTVNEDSSETAAQVALIELRRMMRYGRLAEKAIRDLQRDGYCNKIVPMLTKPDADCVASWRSESALKADVRLRKLPKKLEISRADLASFSSLQVRLGKMKNNSHGGHDCKEVELWLEGMMTFQSVPFDPIYMASEDRIQIGEIRINKGYLSWLKPADNGYGTDSAYKIFQNPKHSGAKKIIEEFAKTISKKLCRVEKRDLHPAAKTLDLQNKAWEWLVEDGVAERLLAEIHPTIAISQVMES